MARKRFTGQQIVHKLREADVELAADKSVPQVVRQLAIRPLGTRRFREPASTLPHWPNFAPPLITY